MKKELLKICTVVTTVCLLTTSSFAISEKIFWNDLFNPNFSFFSQIKLVYDSIFNNKLIHIKKDNEKWKDLYIEKVKNISEKNKDIKFDLVYIDEDNIPELVADQSGFYSVIYSTKNNSIIPLSEGFFDEDIYDENSISLSYGTHGRGKYGYLPNKNILNGFVHYEDTNYASNFEDFYNIKDNKLSLYKTFEIRFKYVDQNNNIIPNRDEYTGSFLGFDQPTFYIDNNLVSEGEYNNAINELWHNFEKDIKYLSGEKNSEEIINEIKEM